jgi:hypothetical protein
MPYDDKAKAAESTEKMRIWHEKRKKDYGDVEWLPVVSTIIEMEIPDYKK